MNVPVRGLSAKDPNEWVSGAQALQSSTYTVQEHIVVPVEHRLARSWMRVIVVKCIKLPGSWFTVRLRP